jgi:hypothetical protein
MRRQTSSVKEGSAPPVTAAPAGQRPRWVDAIREFALGDSIPERTRLTTSLERWIADFQPEVLYTILGSNGMMSLVEKIRNRFALPVVIHIMDDWPNTAHRHGLFAATERRRMQQWLDHFISIAKSCLGICPPMCEAYKRRYGRDFRPFQYALDLERWATVNKHNLESSRPPEFLYVGSIFRNAQLESLIDCARAIGELNTEGFPAKFRIVTSPDNCVRYRSMLAMHQNITMEVSDSDEDAFFRRLAAADALVLPVNFDGPSIEFIRYSMPTKVPAYLNSGSPILVYGPAETAQVRYAIEDRWGLVVQERSLAQLKSSLKQIILDSHVRETLSATARAAAANHDARVVRSAFQRILCESTGQ